MDLITFTEEILNGKLHFLCSATDRKPGNIGIRGCSVHKTPTEYCRGRSWLQCQQRTSKDSMGFRLSQITKMKKFQKSFRYGKF